MESDRKNDLDVLRELTEYYVRNDIEDRDTEQKARIDLSTKKKKAELVRDFLCLANVPYADPPNPKYERTSYLIVGSKNGRFLVDAVGDLPEESDVRGILDAYVHPPLEFSYVQFEIEGESRWVGVFSIQRTGQTHEVLKELREGKERHLVPGESWSRRGSTKVPLTPLMKDQIRTHLQADRYSVRESALEVLFYHDGLRASMSALPSIEIIRPKLIEWFGKVESSFGAVDTIDLNQGNTTPTSGPNVPSSPGTPVVFPERNQSVIREVLRLDPFNTEVYDDFFDLGGLLDKSIIGSRNLIGTSAEKEKYESLQMLYKTCSEFVGVIRNLMDLRDTYVVPLALTNTGSAYDEDIRVLLTFPEGVELVGEGAFRTPDYTVVDELVSEGGTLHRLVVQPEDHTVRYESNDFIDTDRLFASTRDDETRLTIKFESFVSRNFGWTTHEIEGKTLVEREFGYLKHNESLAFESNMLVEATTTFDIEYSITSKNHPNVQEGKITYVIPESGK